MFSFKVICAAGVLFQGVMPDFLLCVATAKQAKATWAKQLPDSTLRVQLFYSNRKRVSSADIAAALVALADPSVAAAVTRRGAIIAAVAVQNSPARSGARTAEICTASGRALASVVDVAFSQAGVVAPPDSPDLGNSIISPCFGLGV